MTEREKFESWCKDNIKLDDLTFNTFESEFYGKQYYNLKTQLMWEAWKAKAEDQQKK